MCPPTLSQSSRLLQTQKAPFQYTELIEKPYLYVTIIIIFSSCKSSNMDMRRMKPKTKPKILPLDKKVPRNPKYENVKSTIDTGNNTRRKEERYEFLRPFFAFLNLLNSYFKKFKDHSPFKICILFCQIVQFKCPTTQLQQIVQLGSTQKNYLLFFFSKYC